MNKKIKSLLVAGLLVVGMGFTSVDSYAAEMTNSITEFNFVNIDGGPVASVHTFEDGNITITIRDVSGYSGHPEGTHEISANWDTSKIDMKSIDVVTMYNAIEASKETTKLELEDGQAFLRIKVDIEQAIDAINLEYEVAGSGGEEQEPAVSFNDAEQKVINKYRESMASVGVLNNGERQIDTSFMIEKDAWLDFIEGVNKADNYVTIEEGNEKGEYHVYTNVSGEKKLIEVIFIDFFESDSKGWVPEITPGTGQAIAVGGMVVLAAAGVGLLVNNKKKKDDEK